MDYEAPRQRNSLNLRLVPVQGRRCSCSLHASQYSLNLCRFRSKDVDAVVACMPATITIKQKCDSPVARPPHTVAGQRPEGSSRFLLVLCCIHHMYAYWCFCLCFAAYTRCLCLCLVSLTRRLPHTVAWSARGSDSALASNYPFFESVKTWWNALIAPPASQRTYARAV